MTERLTAASYLRPQQRSLPLLAALVAVIALSACGTEFSNCAATRTCPPDGAAGAGGTGSTSDSSGGSGGATGSGGSAGDSSTSASGGSGGSSGETTTSSSSTTGAAGAAGGAGDSGNPPPCNDACQGATPACNENTDTCVECLETNDCDQGVCNPDTNTCVECLESDHCEAPTPLCETEQSFCVECLQNNHCRDPQQSYCNAGSCTPCQTNEDCAHLENATVCDISFGECVECTGTDYQSCGLNSEEPFVCDTLSRTCTEQVEHDAGLCVPCVSDSHCAPGHMCALQTYNNQEVGYFCFWKQGDTENGAPDSCGTARPYFDTLSQVRSIDGQTADICGLRTSTCVARQQFSSLDCGTTAPDNSLCGVAAPADAVCVQAALNLYRCTMTCGVDDDCPPSFNCNTAVATPHCEL